MKKILSLILALVMVFSLVACGTKTEEEAPEEEAPVATEIPEEEIEIQEGGVVEENEETTDALTLIGYTVSSEPEFQTRVRTSLQAACDERGYDLKIGVHGGDTTKQRAFVEAFINAGAEVCMDFASNSEIGAALAELCDASGVFMVGIDGDYGEPAFYYGTNNPLCATNNGTILGEWVRDNWEGKVDKYVRFSNPEWPPILQARTEGGWDAFCKVLPEYADKKDDVFCEVFVNADDLVTQQNVRDWFTKQDDAVTSAWISLSDNSLMVAVTEIESLGKAGQTVCVSNDCIAAFLEQLIIKGEDTCWVSSLNFRPDNYGKGLVKLAEDLVTDAESVPYMTSFELPGCNINNVQEMFPEKYAEVTATM
ncbi:MAG: hypothetical protein E7332_08010 [Clostridiales bacterium]|nr:hypothetical protein [Clostridiales bacterium]